MLLRTANFLTSKTPEIQLNAMITLQRRQLGAKTMDKLDDFLESEREDVRRWTAQALRTQKVPVKTMLKLSKMIAEGSALEIHHAGETLNRMARPLPKEVVRSLKDAIVSENGQSRYQGTRALIYCDIPGNIQKILAEIALNEDYSLTRANAVNALLEDGLKWGVEGVFAKALSSKTPANPEVLKPSKRELAKEFLIALLGEEKFNKKYGKTLERLEPLAGPEDVNQQTNKPPKKKN